MNRFLFFLFLIFLQHLTYSQVQKNALYDDFNFLIHLTKNGLMNEAELEKKDFFSRTDITQVYKDSVNFLLGMAYRNNDRSKEARNCLMEVSPETFLYYKSRYLAGIIDLENDQPDSCLSNFVNIELSDNKQLNELKQFETAGVYLYNKNLTAFDSLTKNKEYENPLLKEENEKLKLCYLAQKKIKRKSAFTAGALSALVPGLGKVYAGNNGQALASFLTVGLMGGIATENYIRLGAEHPQTIFFAGLCGLFYIGNIWGSAVSVQVVKTEKELENKHNILVGIKLPISKFFN